MREVTFGFNRYIVECKCTKIFKYAAKDTGFNRYIVECKSRKTLKKLRGY